MSINALETTFGKEITDKTYKDIEGLQGKKAALMKKTIKMERPEEQIALKMINEYFPEMKTIEKTELRIGNFFTDELNKTIFSVYEIMPDWVCGNDIENTTHIQGGCQLEYKDVIAIPITKEWLLKMGFEKNDNKSFSDSFYWIMVGGSKFNINPDNGVIWVTKEDNIFNNPCLITSIHQLQNSYFALTGKELKFKKRVKK